MPKLEIQIGDELHRVVYIDYNDDGIPHQVMTACFIFQLKKPYWGLYSWDFFPNNGNKEDIRAYNSGSGGTSQEIPAPQWADGHIGKFWIADDAKFEGTPKNFKQLKNPIRLKGPSGKTSINPFKVAEITYSYEYCDRCGHDIEAFQAWKNPQKKYGKYGERGQYLYRCPVHGNVVEPYYYASYNAIDWSDVGTRIGDRKKPLVANTERRIRHGLKKYGRYPFYVLNYTPGLTNDLTKPFGSITTVDHHALAVPFTIKGEHISSDDNSYVKSIVDSLSTQTTRQTHGLVIPWIIEMNKTGEAKPAESSPLSTITAGGINNAMLQVPFIIENKGQSNSRGVNEPMASLTTKPHLGLLNAFIPSYYGKETTKHITEPLGTVTTKDRHTLVQYSEPVYEDCYYRMLKAPEVKKGMAFDDNYIILGDSKAQIKQLGNAVPPPMSEWIVDRCLDSIL